MEYIFDFQFSLINNHLSIINIYAVFAGFGEKSGYNLVDSESSSAIEPRGTRVNMRLVMLVLLRDVYRVKNQRHAQCEIRR